MSVCLHSPCMYERTTKDANVSIVESVFLDLGYCKDTFGHIQVSIKIELLRILACCKTKTSELSSWTQNQNANVNFAILQSLFAENTLL